MEGTEAADDYFCADEVETRTQYPNSLADEPEASGDGLNLFEDQISDDEEVGVSNSIFIYFDFFLNALLSWFIPGSWLA